MFDICLYLNYIKTRLLNPLAPSVEYAQHLNKTRTLKCEGIMEKFLMVPRL